MLVFEEMVSGFGGYDESGEEVDDAKYHVIENIIYATLIYTQSKDSLKSKR